MPDAINKLAILGQHQVPGIWKYFIPDGFWDLKIPTEAKSKCRACPEIKDSKYRPDYRCCTFQPRIPNFMIGLALLEKKHTSHSILRSLKKQRFFTPEGLIASPKRWSLFLEDLSNDQFGKSSQVLCHFLNKENELCNIYNYRNGPCSTFFCRHDSIHGESFWESLMVYINQIEHSLSQWAMKELGIEPEQYFKLFDEYSKNISIFKTSDQGWPDEVLKKTWRKWYGKEFEFYKQSANLIKKNKDNLISIAESNPPKESLSFEKAIIKSMPTDLQMQVDDNDLNEGEVTSLSYLYKVIMFHYREMQHNNR